MRRAVELVTQQAPDLEIDGEMQADLALDEDLRQRIFPNSRLKGQANLMILPDLNAANIAFNLLKSLGGGLPIGPMLIGTAKPVHILTPSVTARGIVNMSALAVVDAQSRMAENS
jgi:malate dehydrogenase (oxaloacetate-decarboxylating)(NADP+)